MPLRQQLKWCLFGPIGRFRYFHETVHFPRWSLSFHAVCQQGVFEADNIDFLIKHAQPHTVIFDVGANIGLMAVPILRSCPTCSVVSFEPSSNVLPFLRKTIDHSSLRSRWSLIEKAVADFEGKTSFSIADPKASLFDGMRDTHRFGNRTKTDVLVTTLDSVWESKGQPAISAIKCDVEGGELAVLNGARRCLQQTKAAVLIEWNAQNLQAYECNPKSILSFSAEVRYRMFAVPTFVEITDATQLKLQMTRTESFVLLPA